VFHFYDLDLFDDKILMTYLIKIIAVYQCYFTINLTARQQLRSALWMDYNHQYG